MIETKELLICDECQKTVANEGLVIGYNIYKWTPNTPPASSTTTTKVFCSPSCLNTHIMDIAIVTLKGTKETKE